MSNKTKSTERLDAESKRNLVYVISLVIQFITGLILAFVPFPKNSWLEIMGYINIALPIITLVVHLLVTHKIVERE